MRKDYYRIIAATVGDLCTLIIKANYHQAVLMSARLAYNRAFLILTMKFTKFCHTRLEALP
eukprot:15363610-Ditylum_brightwellii.AAC.1